MYAVYTTRGFILSSAPSGETSKTYQIYTEGFGLIRARAQGVRLLRSKLRYNLDDYALVDLSLVRGKEFWRITGASGASSASDARHGGGLALKGGEPALIRARVLNLVRRLVHGEEQNEALFAALVRLDVDVAEIDEVSILIDVLAALGYIDHTALTNVSNQKRIAAINDAIRNTQL